MSVIGDLRAGLAAELAPLLGVPVSPAWPDVLNPPCAFVAPPLTGEYVRAGQLFGEHVVAVDLVILVDHDDPAPALAALDTLVELAVVHTADWGLVAVDPPAPVAVADGGAEYLAAVVHLSKPIRLT